ncbi:MAG: hypothetical protein CMO44_14290 [Verrucomicrobiales bacterium]|nr:hypothetical protein [Verrucomicrobiales bacterium]|tara:strand:+ start:7456 stop:7848 length:393 start_codon:yes stop_codon:yes gene_type:complete
MELSLSIAGLFIILAMSLSGISFWNIETKKDIPRLNKQFQSLENDAQCKGYLKKISLLPSWRRNLLAATLISVLVAFFVSASFPTCVAGGVTSKDQVVATTLVSSLICTFMVTQAKSGYESWHILCDGEC